MAAEGARRGWFVTIEGPEGAGKTTQADRLRRRAERAGIPVLVTREPGGTVVGERVRELLLDPAAHHTPRTDALLFNAARAQRYPNANLASALRNQIRHHGVQPNRRQKQSDGREDRDQQHREPSLLDRLRNHVVHRSDIIDRQLFVDCSDTLAHC